MNNYDDQVQTNVAILDLDKVFDTTPHKYLLHILCHILSHQEQNSILTKFQLGFSSGHSSESQLLRTLHDLMNNS